MFALLAATVVLPPIANAQLSPVLPELRRVAPMDIVNEAAKKARVPLSNIAASTNRAGLRKGDSVTALVSHVDAGQTRQWLVFLAVNPPTEKDAVKPPPDFTLYSSSGREIRIPGEASAIAIRVLGPYQEGRVGSKNAKDRWSGTPVNQAFLALGLDRACEASIRLATLGNSDEKDRTSGFELSFGTQRFPTGNAALTRSVLDRLGVTAEDEHALAGSAPALMSFLQIVGQTPGLEEILRSVLDIPWITVIKNGGKVAPSFNYLPPFTKLNAADWGLPAGTNCYVFRFQLMLGGKPALNCQMAVAAARPPLLTSAGIVGLSAQRPDGKGPLLSMQVIDARYVETETGSANAAVHSTVPVD